MAIKSNSKKTNTSKKIDISKKINTSKKNNLNNLANKLLDLKTYTNKKVIVAIALAFILLIVFAVSNIAHESKVETKKDNINANVTAGVIQNIEFKGLKFSNISLIRNKETKQYTFTAHVTNTTKEKINIKQVDIILKNKKGEELITLLGYIGQDGLEANNTMIITSSTSDSIDLSKAVTKEIREHKN